MKIDGIDPERTLGKHESKGKRSLFNCWLMWALIQIVIKIFKKGKEVINHKGEKDNSLNIYLKTKP